MKKHIKYAMEKEEAIKDMVAFSHVAFMVVTTLGKHMHIYLCIVHCHISVHIMIFQ